MDFLYRIATASLVLRLMHRLIDSPLPIEFVTVLLNDDHWIIRVKGPEGIPAHKKGDFEAFLDECGCSYQPNVRIQNVLEDLEHGQSALEAMQQYQVVVLVHGMPNLEEVQIFQKSFTMGIGSCPPSLA